jgi:outer membrane protein
MSLRLYMYFNKNDKTLFIILAITILTATSTAFISPALADYKIATIDITKVLNETAESKAARQQLDKEAQAARARIEKEKAGLKKKEEGLIAKKVAQDSPEVEKFRKEAREFSRSVKDSEDELRRKFAKMNNQLTEKAMKIIEQYAKNEQIDLVLDKGSAGRGGPVLFGTPHVDITDQIIAKMKG